MGVITPSLAYITKTYRCKPERLVSGLMTVNVRHEMVGTVNDLGEIDCNWAYNQRWDDDPNDVDSESDYPYYGDLPSYATAADRRYVTYVDGDSAGGTSDRALTFTQASCVVTAGDATVTHPSNANIVANLSVTGTGIRDGCTVGSKTSNTEFELSLKGTANGTVTLTFAAAPADRKLSIGDFDCFLFYVTSCAHLEAPYHPNSGHRTTKTGSYYYSRPPADKCQSFVKSHLISRINNAAETEAAGGLDMYKQGILRNEWGFADNAGVSPTETATVTPYPYLVTNGVYDNSNNFGNNLTLGSGHNTFFTPVYNISIGATHSGASSAAVDIDIENEDADSPLFEVGQGDQWYASAITHDATYWDLQIKVALWTYLDGSSSIAYFKNRVNVFWQPFGETTEIELQ